MTNLTFAGYRQFGAQYSAKNPGPSRQQDQDHSGVGASDSFRRVLVQRQFSGRLEPAERSDQSSEPGDRLPRAQPHPKGRQLPPQSETNIAFTNAD